MEKKKSTVPAHESVYICTTLALVGGFLEAYTFLLKGEVFCNAQTGNFALMGIALAKGELFKALTYVIPMFFYLVGIIITVKMPQVLSARGRLQWETVFILFEMAAFVGIGFIPAQANYLFSTVLISFICAMQYNTFKKMDKITFASTFCTNNLRQAAIHLSAYAQTKNKTSLKNSLSYFLVNGVFLLGAVLGTVCIRFFSERAIWMCAAVLAPPFVLLLADNARSIDRKRKSPNRP